MSGGLARARVREWLDRGETLGATMIHVGRGEVRLPKEGGGEIARAFDFAIHDGPSGPIEADVTRLFVRSRPMVPRPISADAPFEDAVVRALRRLLKSTRWELSVWTPAEEGGLAEALADERTLRELARRVSICESVTALHGWRLDAAGETHALWYLLRDPKLEDGGGRTEAPGVLLAHGGRTELLSAASLMSAPPPAPEAAPVDPKAALAAIGYAWSVQKDDRLAIYDEALFGGPLALPEVGLAGDEAARADWLRLFAGALVLRDAPDLPAAVARLRGADELIALCARPEPALGEALERLVARVVGAGDDADAAAYWLPHAGLVSAIARALPAFVGGLLDALRAGLPEADALCRLFPAEPSRGLAGLPAAAACVVVRELLRRGVVAGEALERIAWVTTPSVRALAAKLGCGELAGVDPFADAAALGAFVRAHRPEDPTFGGAFDLPLFWLAADADAKAALFG